MYVQENGIEIKSLADNINDPIFGGVPELRTAGHSTPRGITYSKRVRNTAKSTAKGAKTPRSLVIIGDNHYVTESYSKATQAYIEALKLDRTNAQIYKKVIKSLIQQQKFDSADSFYNKLIEISNNRPDYIAEYLLFKIASLGLDFDRRSNEIKELILTYAYVRNDRVFNAIGIFYLITGELDLAKNYILDSITINPDNVDATNNFGLYYKLVNDNDNAKKYFQKAHYLDLKYVAAYENLGSLYYELNKPNEALSILKEAKTNAVKLSDEWRTNYAVLLSESLRFDEAIDEYKSILNTSPNNFLVINNLGNAYVQSGDTSKALESFIRAVELYKNYYARTQDANPIFATLFNNLSQYYIDNDDLDSAQSLARSAQHFFPSHYVAFYQESVISIREENFTKAKTLLLKALELSPGYLNAIVNLSYILEDIDHNYEAASSIIEAYISEFNPNSEKLTILNNNLAYAYLKQGKVDKAIPFLSLDSKYDTDSSNYAFAATHAYYYLCIGNEKKADDFYSISEEVAPSNVKSLVRQFKNYEFMRYWISKGDLSKAVVFAKAALNEPKNLIIDIEVREFLKNNSSSL